MFTKSLAAAAVAAMATANYDVEFTSNHLFNTKNPAFVNMGKFHGSDEDFLLVSSFGAYASGKVYIVRDIKDAVVNSDVSDLKPTLLDTPSFKWPNNIEVVPYDVFGERAIQVPDGFLVPGKKDGNVFIIRMDADDITKTTETVQITEDKKHYFYHMGYWVDLNGDGRKDFVTARSNAKAGDGELLWLEHPAEGLDSTEKWTEHVLGNIADVSIEVLELPEYPGEVVVFAAHFFDEAIRMHRVSKKDGSLIASKTIDDTNILSAYNVTMVDLNNDGNRQLLVNNHETKDAKNGIWAYEFPADPMNDDWSRQTIASNFHNAFSIFVPQMSPGFGYAICPKGTCKKGERQHILIAGDGDHSAHALYPTGDASKFEYENTIFDDAKGTVGAMCFSDLDQDGWLEVWVPNYDKDTIELYKMNESVSVPTEFLQ